VAGARILIPGLRARAKVGIAVHSRVRIRGGAG
jgi:hypothetical protein